MRRGYELQSGSPLHTLTLEYMKFFTSGLIFAFTVWTTALSAQERAKNIILFLGDAGGLSSLNAAKKTQPSCSVKSGQNNSP